MRKGPAIDLDFESVSLRAIHVDNNALFEEERTGSAKKLLGASALYCYVTALDKAHDTRGAKCDAITAKATVQAASNDKVQGRILGISLDVTVHMDADYEDIFERVTKVMRRGGLISASLEAAFPITYNLELECPDD